METKTSEKQVAQRQTPQKTAVQTIARELPPFAEMDKAFRERDVHYDGIFWVGVRSTGIFCKPSCPARKPLQKNTSFFASTREAIASGYRPCLRCKPLETRGEMPDWAQSLLDNIEKQPGTPIHDDDLRLRGLEPVTVRRFFQKNFGMSFQSYARARRLSQAFQSLQEGNQVDDAVFDSGWESHSGFREAFVRRFGSPPGQVRGKSASPDVSATNDFIRLSWIESPLGALIAGASEKGICLLEFCDRKQLDGQLESLRKRFGLGLAPGKLPLLDKLELELDEYFKGQRKSFDLPLDVPGTEFQSSVWKALQHIGYGTTESYEGLARKIDKASAVRAVANANGKNRVCILIPCHRVIGKDGSLTGYAGGMWRKQRLLRLESGFGIAE